MSNFPNCNIIWFHHFKYLRKTPNFWPPGWRATTYRTFHITCSIVQILYKISIFVYLCARVQPVDPLPLRQNPLIQRHWYHDAGQGSATGAGGRGGSPSKHGNQTCCKIVLIIKIIIFKGWLKEPIWHRKMKSKGGCGIDWFDPRQSSWAKPSKTTTWQSRVSLCISFSEILRSVSSRCACRRLNSFTMYGADSGRIKRSRGNGFVFIASRSKATWSKNFSALASSPVTLPSMRTAMMYIRSLRKLSIQAVTFNSDSSWLMTRDSLMTPHDSWLMIDLQDSVLLCLLLGGWTLKRLLKLITSLSVWHMECMEAIFNINKKK